MIANVIAGQRGTRAQLQQLATTQIAQRLGQLNSDLDRKGLGGVAHYELAWGPVVYQAPRSDVAENVMYVVRNTKQPSRYTIGIAGTNFASPFDFLIEDSLVGATAPWIEGKPRAGRIALGTSIGLHILRNLEAVPSIPAHAKTPLTLRQYLEQQLGTKKGNVSVTGHSLGGALSPVVGLWLFDHTATDWPNATIDVYAFAPPTPGDATFARYYARRLGSRTTRVWNRIDAVPYAWQQQEPPQLSQIPGLFQNLPPNGKVGAIRPIKDFVTVLEYISRKTPYTQVDTAPGFSVSTYADVSACKSDFTRYLVQAVYQHVDAYGDYYKVPTRTTLSCDNADALADELSAKVRQELTTIRK
jgi:hypothetical protein